MTSTEKISNQDFAEAWEYAQGLHAAARLSVDDDRKMLDSLHRRGIASAKLETLLAEMDAANFVRAKACPTCKRIGKIAPETRLVCGACGDTIRAVPRAFVGDGGEEGRLR